MNILEIFVYKLIYMVLYALGLLPAGVRDTLTRLIGGLWFRVDKRHRELAVDNMTRAFPELSPEQIRRLAKKNFRQFSKLLFEIGWSLRIDENNIHKHVKTEGLTHLKRAFRKQKGVIILTGHLGCWELLTLAPLFTDDVLCEVYRPLDFNPLDHFFNVFRSRFGVKPIPKHRAMRKILKAISAKEGVGIPLDQSIGHSEGVFVDFFDQPTCTNKGMALIAMKTGAPVVPVFMVREGTGLKVLVYPEIPLVNTGNKESDVTENTAAYNRAIEKCIRKYPDQWFWVHNRWKTKPLPEHQPDL